MFTIKLIGFSEIFNCDKDQRLALSGYHKIITRCRDDGNHGGVGLFTKQHINFKIREDLSIFIPDIFESIFIESSSNTNKNNIVRVIYRPNSQPKSHLYMYKNIRWPNEYNNFPFIWNMWCNFISNVSSRSDFKKQLNYFILSWFQIQWPALTKDAAIALNIMLLSISILEILSKNWSIQLNSVLYFVSS